MGGAERHRLKDKKRMRSKRGGQNGRTEQEDNEKVDEVLWG